MPKHKSSRKMKSSHPNRQLPPQATASLARNQPVQRCSACHFPCMLSQSRERVKQEVVQGRVNLRALSCRRYTRCTHIASSSRALQPWIGMAMLWSSWDSCLNSCRFCLIKAFWSTWFLVSSVKHLKAGIRSVSVMLGQQMQSKFLVVAVFFRLNGPLPSILARRSFRMVLILGQWHAYRENDAQVHPPPLCWSPQNGSLAATGCNPRNETITTFLCWFSNFGWLD